MTQNMKLEKKNRKLHKLSKNRFSSKCHPGKKLALYRQFFMECKAFYSNNSIGGRFS